MSERIFVASWHYSGDKVELNYSDGTTVFVRKSDFDRTTMTMFNATKDEIIRDFAIL